MKILQNLKLRISSSFISMRLTALQLLSKRGIIREHKFRDLKKIGSSTTKQIGEIKSSRYVFNVSRVEDRMRNVNQYWFETKGGKRILTLLDEDYVIVSHTFQFALVSFLAHLSPLSQMWLHRDSARTIKILSKKPEFPVDLNSGPIPKKEVPYTEIKCSYGDFLKCRYFIQRTHIEGQSAPDDKVFLSEMSLRLDSKIPEINKILTGVDDDGELTLTRDGVKMLLAEDFICVHCGLPVFTATTGSYQFSCVRCGDTRYGVRRVNHPFYSVRKKETYDTLIELCNAAGDTL